MKWNATDSHNTVWFQECFRIYASNSNSSGRLIGKLDTLSRYVLRNELHDREPQEVINPIHTVQHQVITSYLLMTVKPAHSK